MKKIILANILLCLLFILYSCSGGITVTARPTDPVFVRPASPGADYVWIDGEWYWSGGSYQYRQGYWSHPRGHRVWHVGEWHQRGTGWYWKKGGWHR
jgi:hypothetical protein